jgi:Fe-Mn family superoxide dismutase
VKHSLPELPYALDALAPHVSAETLEYHWGKHHRAYVDTLNRLLPATPLEGLGLEALVRRASGGVLNQAAQHFNHSVYWLSLSPKGGGEPEGALLEALGRRYGSFAAFRTAFTEKAGAHFGSGWAWLVRKPDGSAQIEPRCSSATSGNTPTTSTTGTSGRATSSRSGRWRTGASRNRASARSRPPTARPLRR